MSVDDTVAAIRSADLWALLAPFAVSLGGSVLVVLARRILVQRTSRHLVVNLLSAIGLVGVVALSLVSYERMSTTLVARALRPLAVGNAKYLGNPDQVARTEARGRASAIINNAPVDPLQFACRYPGWSVHVLSIVAICLGILVARRRWGRENRGLTPRST